MLKVHGYASVFGNVDLDGEVVDKGAFSAWIAENQNKSLPLFWNHSHRWKIDAKPIGHTTQIRQDKHGLYFEGEVLDTPEGLEVQELLSKRPEGRMAASFYFNTHDRYQKNDVWHLAVLEPKEITATNWGANPEAYIEAVPVEPAPEENGA